MNTASHESSPRQAWLWQNHALEHVLSLARDSMQDCSMTENKCAIVQVGYLTSWSAHSTYVQRHPDRPDPLEQFRKDYKKAFGFTSDDEKARVTWPLFVILAKESQPV